MARRIRSMRQKKFRVVDLPASALDVVVDDVFLNCRGHLLPTLCTLAPLVDHLVLVIGQNSRFRQPCVFDLFYYRKFWAQCSVSFRDKKIAAKSLIFCRKCAKNELQHWQSASSREKVCKSLLNPYLNSKFADCGHNSTAASLGAKGPALQRMPSGFAATALPKTVILLRIIRSSD